MDREKVIKGLECCTSFDSVDQTCMACPFENDCVGKQRNTQLLHDALALLKEQEDLGTELTYAIESIRRLQKDKDKLCLEVSEWKHKFHDRPLKDAVEPFHRCIGKDFSLIEDSHFDYCPYCGKPITWAKQEGR